VPAGLAASRLAIKASDVHSRPAIHLKRHVIAGRALDCSTRRQTECVSLPQSIPALCHLDSLEHRLPGGKLQFPLAVSPNGGADVTTLPLAWVTVACGAGTSLRCH
jgi:hypothetical protein